MKWIGQHVWSFISRFRSDVYLEDISTGTIASGADLGLDSNNKIVKAAKNTSPNIYGDYIRITLADFAMGGYTGNTKFGVAFDKTAGIDAYGVRVADSAAELYTFVTIPQGYKATHVEIYGRRTKAVEAFEVQINASTAVSKGTGICNTEFPITNVSSTATNLLMIEVVVNSNAADRVYGGRVKIAAI